MQSFCWCRWWFSPYLDIECSSARHEAQLAGRARVWKSLLQSWQSLNIAFHRIETFGDSTLFPNKEKLPKKRKCFYFDKNVNFLSAAVAVIRLVTGVSAGEGELGQDWGPGMIMKSSLQFYNQKRLCKKEKLSPWFGVVLGSDLSVPSFIWVYPSQASLSK